MKQKGLAPILIILVIAIFFIVFSFFFLATPHKVSGKPIAPFKNGELVLSEKVTYLFKKPEVGDRIVFFPTTQGIDFVGVVTSISDDKDVKIYTVLSGGSRPWSITQDKIVSKVYFPFISKKEILANLPSPSPSPSPKSTPAPSSDETANWKIYNSMNFGYQIKHPDLLLNQCNVGGIEQDDKLDVVLSHGQPKQGTEYCGDYIISIFIASDRNESVAEKLDKLISFQVEKGGIYGGKKEDYIQQEVSLGTISVTKLTMKTSSFLTIYAFKDNEKIYYFLINDRTEGKFSDEIVKILSTFKFISQ